MKCHRIWAIILRNLIAAKSNWTRLFDMFYWPILNLVLWGMMSVWMEQQKTQVPHVVLTILTVLVFWELVSRASIEIVMSMLEEMWQHNLINLFASPLTVGEWIVAAMIIACIKLLATLLVGAAIVWLLYSLNIFSLGWMMLPFIASLLISGWWIGLTTAGCIVYWGHSVESLAWAISWVFAPLSSVFYPVNVLPPLVQKISYCLPMTYVFEGMRKILATGSMPMHHLLISFALNGLYLTMTLSFFMYMFHKSREKGLARL